MRVLTKPSRPSRPSSQGLYAEGVNLRVVTNGLSVSVTDPRSGSGVGRTSVSIPSARVLVVDHDQAILRTMEVNLQARGYEALLASDARQALAVAAARRPDVVVLDLGLPDHGGMDVIDGLRGWTSVPIIALSAHSTEADKVTALDAGANDYMTKPFGIAELMARLRVALRTPHAANETPLVVTVGFHIGPRGQACAPRGLRRPSDGHRVGDRGVPGPQPWPSCHASAAARAGVGLDQHEEQLRAGVSRGDSAQARARAPATAVLSDRAPSRRAL